MPEINDEFISPWEIFDSCGKREKNMFVELVISYLSKNERGVAGEEYQKSVVKLLANRHRLSVEDEETINKIANKI